MTVDRVSALRRTSLLSGLADRDLEALAAIMRECEFEAAATVTAEGRRDARVLAFFVIVEGTATVSRGGRPVATLGPGDHFGEIGLFLDRARTASVTASTPLRCLALAAWEFRPFVEQHREVAWTLLETMARRLADLLES
jgi:CRP-like cAMP-binding protein